MGPGDATHYDYHLNSYTHPSSYYDAQGVFQPDTHTSLAPTQEPLHASTSFSPLGASSETPAPNRFPVSLERTNETHPTLAPIQVPLHTSTSFSPPGALPEAPALNASPVGPERTGDIAAVLASQRRQFEEMQNRIKALESQLAGTKRASEGNDREVNVEGGNGREGNSREEKGRKKRKLGGLMLLTEEQSKVKKRLMKEVRNEMKNLTGRGKSGRKERSGMALDFKGTATSEKNRLVIQQAAKKVADAHKHPQTGQYELGRQPFTLADCVSFASTTFNSWKAVDKIDCDWVKETKNRKHQRKNRRYGRRVALSKRRKSERLALEIRWGTLPDEIFDPEFMTSCHSDLDSSDASDCASDHRERMFEKAGIPESLRFNVNVWELRKKEFRSRVFNSILKVLDDDADDTHEYDRRRPTTVKVNLDRKIENAPAEGHRIFPFMINTEWLRNNVAEGKKLKIEEKDPDNIDCIIREFVPWADQRAVQI